MIEIKTYFNGWVQCTPERAKEWVLDMRRMITAIKTEEKDAFIQGKLRGITIEELLGKEGPTDV